MCDSAMLIVHLPYLFPSLHSSFGDNGVLRCRLRGEFFAEVEVVPKTASRGPQMLAAFVSHGLLCRNRLSFRVLLDVSSQLCPRFDERLHERRRG